LAAHRLTCFALQVQALAEFGDLPKNVDLIVLQQLPHSSAHNVIEVPIAPQRNVNRATAVARCSCARVDSSLFSFPLQDEDSKVPSACLLLNAFCLGCASGLTCALLSNEELKRV
jgi:hypothetical protein